MIWINQWKEEQILLWSLKGRGQKNVHENKEEIEEMDSEYIYIYIGKATLLLRTTSEPSIIFIVQNKIHTM